MYFLLKMGMFQPAMLVYQRVTQVNNIPAKAMDPSCFVLLMKLSEILMNFRKILEVLLTVINDKFSKTVIDLVKLGRDRKHDRLPPNGGLVREIPYFRKFQVGEI